MTGAAQQRRWVPARPVDLAATVSTLVRGDPSHRFAADGSFWRATRTPAGPGTLRVVVDRGAGEVVGTAWGDGAQWLLAGLPELLGAADTTGDDFRPKAEHWRLVAAWQARTHWRVPRSRAVFESLSMAVLEQVVTGKQARQSIRTLITRFGEPAPGPPPPGPPTGRSAGPLAGPSAGGGSRVPGGLVLPPTPAQWAAIPSWEWLRAGVEQRRNATVIVAARVAGRLEATLDREPQEADRLLRTLPGVGRWTAAEVRQRAHGDPDAFSFDDFHVARNVSWALTGEVLDDDGCAEVIACYAGHRYRVQRLLELARVARPRRGPRLTLPTHTPIATGGRS